MDDKRRFPRHPVDFAVDLFSQTRVALGKAKAVDISNSGMSVSHNLNFIFKTGTEIFLSFQLPGGKALSKIRGEVRGIAKNSDGSTHLKLRFTEMKVLDAMKEYMALRAAEGGK